MSRREKLASELLENGQANEARGGEKGDGVEGGAAKEPSLEEQVRRGKGMGGVLVVVRKETRTALRMACVLCALVCVLWLVARSKRYES